MRVTFYQRRPLSSHKSIEGLFDQLRKFLPPDVNYTIAVSRYHSQGFFGRLYNMVEAVFRQGEVNHITGDVHYLALLLRKKKTILTIHDCGFMQHPSPFARFLLSWFWLKLPVMRSRFVTVISEATRQDVLRYTACSTDKLKLIPNFVSPHFVYTPKAFRREEPVLLQIGTKPNKNIARLAEALQGISCKLHIIGKPREEDRAALEQHGISYYWETDLTEAALLQAYVDCDILVMVSTYEGFGLPIVEAQAVGRPVITSNCSSMPEVAGKGACLVDPFDAISIRKGVEAIIQNVSFRKSLIQKGKINQESYTLEKILELYYALYHQIISYEKYI